MENLAEFRRKQFWSQNKLAKEAEVNVSVINRIERGITKDIHLGTIQRLCEALKVEPYDVAEFEPIMRGKNLPVQTVKAAGRLQEETGGVTPLSPTLSISNS